MHAKRCGDVQKEEADCVSDRAAGDFQLSFSYSLSGSFFERRENSLQASLGILDVSFQWEW